MGTFYDAPNDYRTILHRECLESGSNYLAHHGVKGMHWGIRHDPVRKGRRRKKGSSQSVTEKKIGNARYKEITDPEMENGFPEGTKYRGEIWDKFKVDEWTTPGAYADVVGSRTTWDKGIKIYKKQGPFGSHTPGVKSNKEMADISKLLSDFKNNNKISYKMTESIANAMAKDLKKRGYPPDERNPGAIMESIFETEGQPRIRFVGGAGSLPRTVTGKNGIGIEYTTNDGGLFGDHLLTQEAIFYPDTGKLEILDPNYVRMDG